MRRAARREGAIKAIGASKRPNTSGSTDRWMDGSTEDKNNGKHSTTGLEKKSRPFYPGNLTTTTTTTTTTSAAFPATTMATVAENFTSLLAHEETEATPRPKDSNAPNLFASSREPLPYDPMLGWYTAATLSGLLLLFLACVGLEKIKGKILMAFDKEHQQDFYRDSADPSNPLAVGIDQGLCRSTRDNAKGSAEDDALLGTRNCIDHNYVYLTLDRPNPAQPDPPNDPPPPPLAPMHQRSPTRQPHAYKDREWKSCDPPLGGPDGHRDHGCRTNSTPTLQTHSVKIEIVEVHSETPIHDFPGKDVQDTAV